MKVHNRRDLIAGLGVAIIGAAYFAETFRIQSTNDPVGPDMLPKIVGVSLVVLGLFIGVTALRSTARKDVESAMLSAAGGQSAVAPTAADDSPDAPEDDDLPDEPDEPPVQLSKLFLYIALFAAYALLLIPLGFLVSTVLFLLTLTTIYNRTAWKRNIIYSVIFTVVVYFAFKDGLGVFLPAGLIG